MTPVRPEFVPDPSLSREEMEALQRRVADAAAFEDDLPFDPAGLSLASDGDCGTDPTTQTVLGGGKADGEAGEGEDGEAGEDEDGEAGEDEDPPAGGSAADPPIVAGVDQAFLDDRAVSAVVALRGGEVIERTHAVSPLSIEYIPGLLSFREGGPILDAFEALTVEPDLALFDGSGRIHYREAGLATHMGVTLDVPSVGVAKSLLCGRPRDDVEGRPAGWRTPTLADGDVTAEEGTVVGYAFQSRQYDTSRSINPLYVSSGHRISAETAVEAVDRLGGEYKLPEPTRLADAYADEVKRDVT